MIIPRNLPPAPPPAKRAFKPFRAMFHGRDAPAPAKRTAKSIGLQEDPKNEERKARSDALKNEVRNGHNHMYGGL
jgi:hypothetical protein